MRAKEITAEILACGEGFSTHEQSTIRLNGGQWDANVERLQREAEKLGGRDPDPHQDDGSTPGAAQHGSLHDPGSAQGLNAAAIRSLVVEEQIRQSIKGGQADET